MLIKGKKKEVEEVLLAIKDSLFCPFNAVKSDLCGDCRKCRKITVEYEDETVFDLTDLNKMSLYQINDLAARLQAKQNEVREAKLKLNSLYGALVRKKEWDGIN